jgi:hypothetical protein
VTSTLTIAASKAAFTHIMDNALQNHNVTSALAADCIDDTFDLFTLTDTIVDNLSYSDPDPNVKANHRLKKGKMGLLKSFIHYIYYRDESGNPIGDKWPAITMADFDKFRSNLAYTTKFGSISTLVTKQTSLPTISSSSAPYSGQSPVDIFKRGIKRDTSVFPTLKYEKFNDQWHRSFSNQAPSPRSKMLAPFLMPHMYLPHLSILHFFKKS